MEPVSSPLILGIDLGTTNSCATVYDDSVIKFVDLEPNRKTLPSAVRFAERKLSEVTVGSAAKRFAITKSQEVFTSFKTLMQDELWQNDPEILEKYKIEDSQLSPTDMACKVLSQIRESAQSSPLGNSGSIDKALICVPAASTPYYKKEVYTAAVKAGFGLRDPETGEVSLDTNGFPMGIWIVTEPEAAAYAYGMKNGFFDYNKSKDQNIMVYDFGGGTFDVSILHVVSEKEKEPTFTLLGTRGITHLGGDDIDRKLMEIVSKRFYKEFNIDLLDPSKDNQANTKKDVLKAQSSLREMAEQAKIELSNGYTEAHFEQLSLIHDNENDEDCNLDMVVTKEEFLEAINPLISETIECVKKTLEEANLTLEDIHRFVLVGGSSKGPWVKDAVKNYIGKDPYVADNVDVIVAEGAGYMASSLATGDGKDPKSKTTHHIGVEIKGGYFVPLVEKGLPFDSEHTEYKGSFKCTNSNNSGRIYITGWSTQEDVIERDEEGNLSSSYSVHYIERNSDGTILRPYFTSLGEFEIEVPVADAHTLDITISMTVYNNNAIKLEVQIGEDEPHIQNW